MYENPLFNPFINPYLTPQGQYAQQPRQEVVKVNGENGARAFQIGANSSALLLDESGALVWLVTTDGAGYKSVAAFDISPHQAAPALDINGLEARITRLEELVNNASTEHFADAERADYGALAARTDQTNDRRGQGRRQPASIHAADAPAE